MCKVPLCSSLPLLERHSGFRIEQNRQRTTPPLNMHREYRVPADDAPYHNPGSWRARDNARTDRGPGRGSRFDDTSFIESLNTRRVPTGPSTLSTSTRDNNPPMTSNADDDGNFIGVGTIVRGWFSPYKTPTVETTEGEMLAARAIAAGEYRFVARMFMWAVWALARSFLLFILPESYKKKFLESSLFTWTVKNDIVKGASTGAGGRSRSQSPATKNRVASSSPASAQKSFAF